MTVTTNALVACQAPKNAIVRLNNASGTTAQTLFTASTNGTLVDFLSVSSTDTGTAYTLQLLWVISATNYLLGSTNIPISAGSVSGTPAVSLLNTINIPGLILDANGNPYFILDSGTGLAVKTTTTITNTAGFQLDVILSSGNF